MNNSSQIILYAFLLLLVAQTIASEKSAKKVPVFNSLELNEFWPNLDKLLEDEVEREIKAKNNFIWNVLWPQFRTYKQQQRLAEQQLDSLIFQTFSTKLPLQQPCSTESSSSVKATDSEVALPCSNISLHNRHRGKCSFDEWQGLAIFPPKTIKKKRYEKL